MGRRRIIDQPCPGRFDAEGKQLSFGEAILQGVRLGATFELACQASGVNTGTVRDWKAAGEARDAEGNPVDVRYAAFAADVETAKGEAMMRALASIREALQGVEERTTRTVTKPVRMRVEHPEIPGQFIDRIEHVTETTVTEGRKVHWQAGAWLLERTQTAAYGRARVWKDLERPLVPAGDADQQALEGIEAAASAVGSAWADYQQGRADGRAEKAAEIAVPAGEVSPDVV